MDLRTLLRELNEEYHLGLTENELNGIANAIDKFVADGDATADAIAAIFVEFGVGEETADLVALAIMAVIL